MKDDACGPWVKLRSALLKSKATHAPQRKLLINQNCLYEISQTMNKKEARTIQEVTIAEVEIIMKNQGLTRAAYNRISLAMRSDALLSDRINILIKQFG